MKTGWKDARQVIATGLNETNYLVYMHALLYADAFRTGIKRYSRAQY